MPMKNNLEMTWLRHRTWAQLILLVVICFIAYSNTFHVPFVFDDVKEIVENKIIRNFDYFWNFSAASGLPSFHGLKMRTLGYLTLAMNYRLGGVNVVGYHIFNFVTHLLTSLLVFKFIGQTLRLQQSGPTDNSHPKSLVPFLVALLFAVHPIQTEAVTYIIQRLASLAAFFSLLSLTSYIHARLEMGHKRSGKALAWFVLSLLSTVAAMKTKEIAFTLPVVIVLYEFLFLQGRVWKRWCILLPQLLTMLIIPLSLTGTGEPVGKIISHASALSRVDQVVSRGDYLCTQFRVIITYLRLIIFPINQNVDHDFPLHPNFFSPEVLFSFLFLTILFCMAVYLTGVRLPLSKFDNFSNLATPYESLSAKAAARLVGFGILWFFITLSVESSIIPINDVMNEHRLYFPSVGIFLALVVTVRQLVARFDFRFPRVHQVTPAVVAMVILLLAGTTFARNQIWQDKLGLWQDVIKKNPRNARGYNNLGAYYDQQGDYEKAIAYFQKAVAIKPDFPEALFGLGISHAALKQTDIAIAYYQRALSFQPKNPEILFNLGVIYMNKGLFGPAGDAFQKALQLDPKMNQARMFLDYARQQTGNQPTPAKNETSK